MAYICERPSCNGYPHYRWDEDSQQMACFAVVDNRFGINRGNSQNAKKMP